MQTLKTLLLRLLTFLRFALFAPECEAPEPPPEPPAEASLEETRDEEGAPYPTLPPPIAERFKDLYPHAELHYLGPLGAGGQAEVHLVELRARGGFHRKAALKVMLPHRRLDPAARERFFAEARCADAVRHHGVIRVLDASEHHGEPFILYEFLDGLSLAELPGRLDRCRPEGALPGLYGAALLAQAARALHAVHEAGILHRDLCPENLFLTRKGRVVLLDFGIAKGPMCLDLTMERSIMGHIRYSPPETLCERPIDARSEVYSLGMVLYFLLTGRRPYHGVEELIPLLAQVATGAPALPAATCAEHSGVLSAIYQRATAYDPEARYESAAHLAEALEAFLGRESKETGRELLTGLIECCQPRETREPSKPRTLPEGLLEEALTQIERWG